MYCSIQEAWPEHKFNNHRMNNIEYFKENIIQDQRSQNPNINNIDINNKLSNSVDKCYSIIEHIESCPNCKHYIMQKYGQNRILELFNTNPQLKETILVFLIGIVILLILNLFYK